MKRLLSIDIETYSDVDLLKSGVYPYVESPNFEILLFAYAFDDEAVGCIDLTQKSLPLDVVVALTDPDVTKTAFNANFEITCISKYFEIDLDVTQWDCTMVRGLMLGLPGSLDKMAKALNLAEQKDTAGTNLIKYFSVPCKPTKVNGGRTRNLSWHDNEKWTKFIEYCIQDVVVEREIRNKLTKHYVIPTFERELWFLDQEINRRGVKIDIELAKNAIECDEWYTEKLMTEAKTLTGLENPNSVSQIKDWLKDQTGTFVNSLTKETVPELIKASEKLEPDVNKKVKRMLKIRQELGKTSVSKYKAMEYMLCEDGNLRGLLAYYGASRTGRWSGRKVQIHNLPQNKYTDLDLARNLLSEGRYEDIELLYDTVPNVLSQLIRTAFIASENSRFIVADFSAIEARVLAWVANEKWRLDVFNTHGKIYEASASAMFKVPIEDIGKGSPLRQKGKVSELALGYGGGAGALEQMGALKMGLNKDELPELVITWRKANPSISKFWKTIERAAIKSVKDRTIVKLDHGITLEYTNGVLYIKLPSGRKLSYAGAKIGEGKKFSNDVVMYRGTGDEIGYQETYGGKLTENIIQAIARDCLAYSLVNVAKAGYKIVMHVHDEIIVDCPYGQGSLEEICNIMGTEIPWAKGLPLRADGYETEYYKKD